MHKLEFKIVEIPEGQSRRSVTLSVDDMDLGDYGFKGGVIDLSFYKTPHFIRVHFELDIEVELMCDRSLEPFLQEINEDYEVVFKTEVIEETEDEEGAVRKFDFSSNTLSIVEEVRDTILLNIPIMKLHPKYYDEEGNKRDFEMKSFGDNDDTPDDSIDPRWEKLKQLKNKDK